MTNPIPPDHLLAPAEYEALFAGAAARWTVTAPGVFFLLGLGRENRDDDPADFRAA